MRQRSVSGLVATLAVVLVACGASSVTTPTSPATSATPSAIASASFESVDPATPTPDPGDGGEFVLPTPDCPPPPGPVVVPDIRVSNGDGPGIIATRGASTFSTCTTVSAIDVTGEAPLPWLTATRQDRLRLEVQNGWRIVRVQGYDHPAVGDGGNIDQAIDFPDGPTSVEVGVPQRDGDARAGWTLWLVRVDGRAVGQLDVQIDLHLPRTSG